MKKILFWSACFCLGMTLGRFVTGYMIYPVGFLSFYALCVIHKINENTL